MSDFLSIGNWRHQCLKELSRNIKEHGAHMNSSVFGVVDDAAKDLSKSSRFVLPPGMGAWYEVMPQLDFSVDRLPFDLVAFEYSPKPEAGLGPITISGKTVRMDIASSKRIILAKQLDESILLRFFFWDDSHRSWSLYPFGTVLVNSTDEKKPALPTVGGMKVEYHSHRVEVAPLGGLSLHALQRGVTDAHIWADTQEESHVVAVVLEMLGCKNVEAKKITGQKKTSSKAPSAIKDDYYRLNVINNKSVELCAGDDPSDADGGARARPGEHIRRGHTYHPKPGLKMWRQGCVVNPGIGRRVEKDYRVDCRK